MVTINSVVFCVVMYVHWRESSVLEDHIVSIFRAEEYDERDTKSSRASSAEIEVMCCCRTDGCLQTTQPYNPEVPDITYFQTCPL
jgi:hypothetical protein